MEGSTGAVEKVSFTNKELHDAQSMGGGLIWLNRTRPDQALAVSAGASKISNNPVAASVAFKRILRYVKGKQGGVFYQCGKTGVPSDMARNDDALASLILEKPSDQYDCHIMAYSDASFAPGDERSITGSVILFQGGAVSWASKKQGLTTLSTCESETVAACTTANLSLVVRDILLEAGLFPLITLRVDARAVFGVVTGNGSRSRHFAVRGCYLRDLVRANILKITHVLGVEQVADWLTKALSALKFHLVEKMGMLFFEKTTDDEEETTVTAKALNVMEESTLKAVAMIAAEAYNRVNICPAPPPPPLPCDELNPVGWICLGAAGGTAITMMTQRLMAFCCRRRSATTTGATTGMTTTG